MTTAHSGVPEARAEQWLSRYATDLGWVNADARALLAVRLAAHRGSRRLALALAGAAAIPLSAGLWLLVTDDSPAGSRWFARCFAGAIALAELGVLLAQELARRADARIAAALPHPVTRGERAGVRTVLGRRETAAAGVSAVLAVTWCGIIWVTGNAQLATSLTLWFLGAGAAAALGLWRAVTRPTVAVDAYSLAIDERMRSQDAVRVTGILWVMWLATGPGGLTKDVADHVVYPAFLISFLVVMLLRLWASRPRSWAG